jgi:DNA-directed RNA polymerase subunit RPC12/RpoP
MLIRSVCPRCLATHQFPDDMAGRYVACPKCNSRYYVTVPPLDNSQHFVQAPAAEVAASADRRRPTLDDLLWDSQQGQEAVLTILRRQESALASLSRDMTLTRRWITVLVALVACAVAAQLAALF